jgi:hypothetical protein
MGGLGGGGAFDDDGPTAAMSELGALCESRSRRGRHQGYVAASWESAFGLVYAKVQEADETGGERASGGRSGSYLLPGGVTAWTAGDKDPVAAVGIVTVQKVGISALLGQRHAVGVWE